MKVYFSDCELDIPEKIQSHITTSTPQISFVKKHFSDIRKETAVVYSMASLIKWEKGDGVAEGMAGCGFSGRAFQKASQEKIKLTLNDISEDCCFCLQKNFPFSKVSCKDIFQWEPEHQKLIFIDFNNFTLKRIEVWENLLKRLEKSCDYFMITDSACFGFRMGNLKTYGVKTPLDYYLKLEKSLAFTGKKLSHYSIFGNAAVLLFSPKSIKLCSEPEEVFPLPFYTSFIPKKRGFYETPY